MKLFSMSIFLLFSLNLLAEDSTFMDKFGEINGDKLLQLFELKEADVHKAVDTFNNTAVIGLTSTVYNIGSFLNIFDEEDIENKINNVEKQLITKNYFKNGHSFILLKMQVGQALAINPYHPVALKGKGLILFEEYFVFKREYLKEEILELEKEIAISEKYYGEHEGILEVQAILQEFKQNFKTAIKLRKKVIRRGAQGFSNLVRLSNLFLKSRRYQLAEDYLVKSKSFDTEFEKQGHYYCQLGEIYSRRGRASQALKSLGRCEKMMKDHPWGKYQLAVAYYRHGKFRKGMALVENLKANFKFKLADELMYRGYGNAAREELKRQNYKKALKLGLDSLKQRPTAFDYYTVIAALLHLDKSKRSKKYLNELINYVNEGGLVVRNKMPMLNPKMFPKKYGKIFYSYMARKYIPLMGNRQKKMEYTVHSAEALLYHFGDAKLAKRHLDVSIRRWNPHSCKKKRSGLKDICLKTFKRLSKRKSNLNKYGTKRAPATR